MKYDYSSREMHAIAVLDEARKLGTPLLHDPFMPDRMLSDVRVQSLMSDKIGRGVKDNHGGNAFAEQHSYMDPNIFRTLVPGMVFPTQAGVRISNEGGYNTTIKRRSLTPSGQHQLVGSFVQGDANLSFRAIGSDMHVFDYGGNSEYSGRELSRDELANIDTVAEYLRVHNDSYLKLLDIIAFNGVKDKQGILMNNSFGVANIPGKAAGLASDTFKNLGATSGDALFNELSAFIQEQNARIQDIGSFRADLCVLPTEAYKAVAYALLNTSGGITNMTVKRAIEQNFSDDLGRPFRIVMSTELNGAGNGGVNRAILMSTTQDSVIYRIPIPFTQAPIAQIGNKFRLETEFSIAGLDFINDTVEYLDGV